MLDYAIEYSAVDLGTADVGLVAKLGKRPKAVAQMPRLIVVFCTMERNDEGTKSLSYLAPSPLSA